MKTAKFIKDCVEFTGTAKLYELSEPVRYQTKYDGDYKETSFVIVSATNAFGIEPETYIFPADGNGEVLSLTELAGSYKGGLNHEEALNNAGYYI